MSFPQTRPRLLRLACRAGLALVLAVAFGPSAYAAGTKVLTFADVMKFRAIQDTVISEDGRWIAFTAQPDRGDGEVQIKSTDGRTAYAIERGSRPAISKNGAWAAAIVKPKAADLEKAGKDKPKAGLALLDLASGKTTSFENIDRFVFSDDGVWLAYLRVKDAEKSETKEKAPEPAAKEPPSRKPVEAGSPFILRRLSSGSEIQIADVSAFAFDSSSAFLAYAVSSADGKANGLYVRDLRSEDAPERAVALTEGAGFTNLTWAKTARLLVFLAGRPAGKDEPVAAALWIFDGAKGLAAAAFGDEALPRDWMIPEKNQLTWSRDGRRLFLGLRPKPAPASGAQEPAAGEESLFDIGRIVEKREVDIWHWNDPLIIPQQKKMWPQVKDKTYTAVWHRETKKLVPLAGLDLPTIVTNENPGTALGLADGPYLKEITWDGAYNDVYLVDLVSGARRLVVSRLGDRPSLSPGGRFVVFFRDRHWHLFDSQKGETRNLTKDLPVAFYVEDDDHPAAPPSYGLAGWLDDESAVVIYDRFDLWSFPTVPGGGDPANLTAGEGRKSDRTFRVLRLDPEERDFAKGRTLLLSSYHNRAKNWGFYAAKIGTSGVARKLEEPKKFAFLAKAKKADVLLYTREAYTEFPDLWVSDLDLASPRKLTDVNPQAVEFAWGTAELVEWASADGVPLQGVLIKPGASEAGKRYPVLVYYYELSAQRLHEWNQIVVNHRPCFPVWASHGYAIFLPDVRFEVGRPGLSAVKCLVPGVQKLVDMGVADPKAIGLHGHSWSGYETAFVVTQTDIFAAAIAGAPVGNMTSAYSGIRWESGMARQFQYEQDQSRIGGTLWNARDRYIENSPVFYADRVKTPLLLMHGDEDGAVPWYQSIEIYLALRRFGKDCIFLQYRGEPHHPQKYPNKLDYSIRMLEYFDHYLKGAPAADWIVRGVPYTGK